MMGERRVVVTGIGAVSCCGLSVDEMWKNIVEGNSGIEKIVLFDTTDYKTKIGGEVHGFDPSLYMSVKDARHMDTSSLYAVAAADEALKDSGLGTEFRDGAAGIDPERCGIIVSSGIGGIRYMEDQAFKMERAGNPSRVSPFLIPVMIANMVSGSLSIRYGMKGVNFAVLSACATGCHSIGEAGHVIRRGDAEIMLAGGAEAGISHLGLGGFCALKALSQRNDDPTHASRPFDADRDGFVMSDGAGVLVLEEYEHAKKRGAKIYGELAGYGATGDAFHITSPAPNGEGGARAMKIALGHAETAPSAVDYVNAHGTSTKLNDKYESEALRSVYGDLIGSKVSVSSTKSTMGHSLGAAGGIESIICLKAIQTGIVPPTINFEHADPECNIDCTPGCAREKKIDIAVNTNLGFGGQNAVTVFKRV